MTTWIILLSFYIIVPNITEISLHSSFLFLVSYVKAVLAFQKVNLDAGFSPKAFWVFDFYKPFMVK